MALNGRDVTAACCMDRLSWLLVVIAPGSQDWLSSARLVQLSGVELNSLLPRHKAIARGELA